MYRDGFEVPWIFLSKVKALDVASGLTLSYIFLSLPLGGLNYPAQIYIHLSFSSDNFFSSLDI